MKALLPPMPVLANESQEQFEQLFDQVAATLKVEDVVELIYIRDFVWPSWEIALYTRHRTVAFDRKLKGLVDDQFSHLLDPEVRRAKRAERLAEYLGQRPPEVGHLVELEDKVTEAHNELRDVLKHTPGELAYNRALERSINLHKDLEFLITSATKRRDQALEMLERYREGLGRRVKGALDEFLDGEFSVLAPPLTSPALPDANPETDEPDSAPPDSAPSARNGDDGWDD
jgi:hypothetical protein